MSLRQLFKGMASMIILFLIGGGALFWVFFWKPLADEGVQVYCSGASSAYSIEATIPADAVVDCHSSGDIHQLQVIWKDIKLHIILEPNREESLGVSLAVDETYLEGSGAHLMEVLFTDSSVKMEIALVVPEQTWDQYAIFPERLVEFSFVDGVRLPFGWSLIRRIEVYYGLG